MRKISLGPSVKAQDASLIRVLQRQNERYRKALEEIARGEGVYGAQAHEYKQIARAALGGGE